MPPYSGGRILASAALAEPATSASALYRSFSSAPIALASRRLPMELITPASSLPCTLPSAGRNAASTPFLGAFFPGSARGSAANGSDAPLQRRAYAGQRGTGQGAR